MNHQEQADLVCENITAGRMDGQELYDLVFDALMYRDVSQKLRDSLKETAGTLAAFKEEDGTDVLLRAMKVGKFKENMEDVVAQMIDFDSLASEIEEHMGKEASATDSHRETLNGGWSNYATWNAAMTLDEGSESLIPALLDAAIDSGKFFVPEGVGGQMILDGNDSNAHFLPEVVEFLQDVFESLKDEKTHGWALEGLTNFFFDVAVPAKQDVWTHTGTSEINFHELLPRYVKSLKDSIGSILDNENTIEQVER